MKEKEGVFHISHSGEFLIWLVIILIFVSLSSLGLIFKEKNDENDYQIFLQDVDGLIVGSPVRMMGIEVGHVTKIKPTNDEVYVKFILTNSDVYIPQGTSVTVEFSGMAGSKSLELYLPQKNDYIDAKLTPVISANHPKRLHDAMSLLNDMFKKLGSIMYTTSSFGTKLQSEGILPTKNKSELSNTNSGLKEFIDYSDKFLDDSNKKVDEMRSSLGGLSKNVK
jgi:hypothetical protein